MDEWTGRQLGGYRIERMLGRGGMGVVFLARETASGDVVALKTLKAASPMLARLLRDEILALRQVRHPNLVSALDDGITEDGRPWVAMELIVGASLADRLQSAAPQATLDPTAASLAPPPRLIAQDTPERLGRPASLGTDPGGAIPLASGHIVGEGVSAEPGTSWISQLQTLDSDALGPHRPRPRGVRSALERRPGGAAAPSEDAAPSAPRALGGAEGSMLRGAPDRRVGLTQALRERLGWMAQVCDALASLHSQGVVHGDLKPDNILISHEGQAIVVDLGLSTRLGGRLDTHVLARAGLLAGTPEYVSPEVIAGDPMDTRVDLYAVGCILMTLITGRPPFVDDDPYAILSAHLEATPPTLASRGAVVPQALEALVAGLLVKDPQARVGHARLVAHALTAICAEDSAAASPAPSAEARLRPSLHAAVLAGRSGLLARVEAAMLDAAAGEGSAVWLQGGEGVGKTRLGVELVRRARARGWRVLAGRSDPALDGASDDAGPLHAFATLMRQATESTREDNPDEELLRQALEGGASAQWLKRFSGELWDSRASMGSSALEAAGMTDLLSQAAHQRVFSALTESLERFTTTSQGLLLMFDDLHLADAMSLAALRHVLQRARTARLPWLVVGLMRTRGLPRGLRDAIQHEDGVVLEVAPLGASAQRAMVDQMLGAPAPEALHAALRGRAEGNPFFAAELLGAAVEVGAVWVDPRGALGVDQAALDALPGSMDALLHSRLERLDPQARAVLEAAAVVGMSSAPRLLGHLTGLTWREVEEALWTLRRARLVEQLQGGQVRFFHARWRNTVYATISGAARTRLHREASRAIDPRGGLAGVRAQALHFARADEPDRARRAYTKAARGLAKRAALDEADRCYTLALRLSPHGAPWRALMLERMEATLLRLGEHSACIRHCEAILADAECAPLERARAELIWATTLKEQGKPHDALEVVEAAFARGVLDDDARLSARAAKLHGDILHRVGRSAEAMEPYQRALPMWHELGDALEYANTLHNMGLVSKRLGALVESKALLEDALERYRALGDARGQGMALHNLSGVARHGGDLEQVMGLLEEALVFHRAVGNREVEAAALSSMGLALCDLDRYGEALAWMEDALELRKRLGSARVYGALLNMGWACYHLGRFERAEALLSATVEHCRRVGNVRKEGLAQLQRVLICTATGELEQAHTIARTLDQHFDPNDLHMAELLRAQARLHMVSGDLDTAEVFVTEAMSVCEAFRQSNEAAHVALLGAELCLARGRDDDALELLESSEQLARSLGASHVLACVHLVRARLRRRRGMWLDASRQLRQAQTIFEGRTQRRGLSRDPVPVRGGRAQISNRTPYKLAETLLEHAWVAHGQQLNAEPPGRACERLVVGMGLGPKSPLVIALHALFEAIGAEPRPL